MATDLDVAPHPTTRTGHHPHNSRIITVEALGQRFPLTLAVERAARVVGISRTAMYAAVRRGDFATIDVNGRLAVLTVPLLRRMGIDALVASTTGDAD